MRGASASSTALSPSPDRPAGVRRLGRIWLVPILLAVVACDEGQPESQAAEIVAPASACSERVFEETRFTVCRFDARTQELQLRWKGKDGSALRSLEALAADLGADAQRVSFAMNGGMYDEAGAPIGLYVEDGKQRKKLNLREGPGNFHLKPNGVFAVDAKGRVSVTPSDRFEKTVAKPRWATQSGPMLVVDGKLHPRFSADGESRFVRNGVGVRDPHSAFFVISEDAVSFGRFARFFRDALGCRNALFLDGSVSSLWDAGTDRMDAYSQLGPMIVALERKKPNAAN
jgi:uncharacterized protein YigE (DUF2233 family)